MTLARGSQVGPFEIIGWIGGGGMGEVYRAWDTRLRREIALKLIAEAFAQDDDRLRRFEQEACAAGQLNHPNVLAVHDVGIHESRPYLVSELLDGESLRSRLRRGPLPLRRAVEYARQIGAGLAAAHAKGIAHRDLKPDNLFVTADDRIKILDFGLAKLTHANDRALADSRDTEAGVVLGTIDYMSPEQVRGETVDLRTDIFSFGVILHEMLSHRAPFARATGADTMAAILTDDPIALLPATIPAPVERIVSRCLEKTRDARFQSASDLAFSLDALSSADLSAAGHMRRIPWLRIQMLPWAVASLFVTILAAAQWARWQHQEAPVAPPLRLTVALGADAPLAPFSMQFGNTVAISRDGSTIAFVAQRSADAPLQLYVRRLDESHASALPGTEGANEAFFSPDGAWIGFDTGLELKKVAVTGGAPIVVTSITAFRGAAWNGDGTIIAGTSQRSGSRLMRVSAAGGPAAPVTTLDPDESIHAWPQPLPGDRAVLYTSSRVAGAFNDANIVVQPLPTGSPKVIQRGGYHAVFVRSGHIVYVHDGALFAMPFDAERLLPTGPAIRVLDGVRSNAITGGAQFSVSENGTLVYLSGPSVGVGTPIDVVDRDGRATPLRTTIANWSTPAFAPDGERLAIAIRQGPSEAGDIWVHAAGREDLDRVTSDPAVDSKPIWTPDGRRLTFASDRAGRDAPSNLYWQTVDGAGAAQRLTTSDREQLPGSWHPSGRFLAYEELTPDRMRDVMILPMEGDDVSGWRPGIPTVFVSGPRMDWEPRFSPDGHWLAYASTESGRWEVYVRPFPGPGPAVQVSTEGGELPTWSETRSEIVYGLDGQLMIAGYAVDRGRFTVQPPRPWPGGRYQTRGRTRMFDLHPDGRHVALPLAPPAAVAVTTAQFVLNFVDTLRRLAPAAERKSPQ